MSRVLLKLSGESFADQDTNFGIESNTLTRIADEISKASETGVQIGIVVGGGNFFRGVSESAKNMAQANACLLYTSPSPRDRQKSRMPSSA